jgi:hypothetical protein
MQDLHEPSKSKAFSKANKSAKSSEETTPLADDKPESSDVTPFMIYLKTGGLPNDKDEQERLGQ